MTMRRNTEGRKTEIAKVFELTPAAEDLTGKKYNRVLVLSFAFSKGGTTYWNGRCDCGTERVFQGSVLRHVTTKSCGCLQREVKSAPKLSLEAAIGNKLCDQIRTSAKKRDLPFTLDVAFILSTSQQPCHYCGAQPGNRLKVRNGAHYFIYNGLDRVDSAQGYVMGNVVPCCHQCNTAKSDFTQEEFIAWARRVVAKAGSDE